MKNEENETFCAIAFCTDGGTITVVEDCDLGNILSRTSSFVNGVRNGRIMFSGSEYAIKRIVIQNKNQNKIYWDSDRVPDVLVDQVLKLHRNAPGGIAREEHWVQDADTILSDIYELGSERIIRMPGNAEKIISIWKNSSDKDSVEELFKAFVGTSFYKYLTYCRDHISRLENNKKDGKQC